MHSNPDGGSNLDPTPTPASDSSTTTPAGEDAPVKLQPPSVLHPQSSVLPDNAPAARPSDGSPVGVQPGGEAVLPPPIVLPASAHRPPSSGGWWTIPVLCLGIAIISCCLLIPQADENRRLAYEKQKLKVYADYVQEQARINEEFLHRVETDPTLAQRLALRRMKMIPQGSAVLELKGQKGPEEMSPFLMVTLPPPPEMPPYQPAGGKVAAMFRHPRVRLYLLGAGLLLIAAGLVLGEAPRKSAVIS